MRPDADEREGEARGSGDDPGAAARPERCDRQHDDAQERLDDVKRLKKFAITAGDVPGVRCPQRRVTRRRCGPAAR